MDFSTITTDAGYSSMLIGALFGAVSSVLVYLAYKGYFPLPSIPGRGVLLGAGAAIVLYYVRGSMRDSALLLLALMVLYALVFSKPLHQFFSLQTLRNLGRRTLFRDVLYSGGLGALTGAISSQFLMVPMRHCTYEADVSRTDYWIGVGVTIASSMVLLFPLWTYFRSGGRLFPPNPSTSGYFRGSVAPYILLLPTIIILVVFLYYPGALVVQGSLEFLPQNVRAEAEHVCLENYTDEQFGIFQSRLYAYDNSLVVTFNITLAVVAISLAMSLFIANLAYQKIKGANIYRTLLLLPYAISPVVAGVIFLAMFNPQVGIVNYILNELFGIRPQWFNDPQLAPWVVIGASVWNILGFNILFYIAGLQSVPDDLLEAASIDGANSFQRFLRIKFPLLSPYTFFLLVTNVTYAFYGIFGVIDTLTQGGPPRPGNSQAGATNALIYSLFKAAEGPRTDYGVANAQSLILFLLVAMITIIQFRVVESRVTYGGE